MRNPNPKHVLAGDDSPRILDLFRDLLETEGHRVTTSAEGLNLERVKAISPDLVIVDHMLLDGEGSGWALLRELRQDPATVDLPVIVCTGAVHRVRENSDLLAELRAHVVLKPFDIADFLATVDAATSPPPPLDALSPSDTARDATVSG